MFQVRVIITGQMLGPLVIVLAMTMLGGFVQQSSKAVGGVKFHGEPQFTVILGAQTTFGGKVSTMVNRCVQTSEVFVQQSVAVHIRSKLLKQTDVKLVMTVMRLSVMFVPQQASNAKG